MKLGRAGLDHQPPVTAPRAIATAKAHRMGDPHRPAPLHGEDRDHDAGEADHRADGEVELAGDHQQAGAHRDDRELGGHHPPVHRALGREHPGVGRHQQEEDEDEDGAADGPELGTHQHLAQRGHLLDALVPPVPRAAMPGWRSFRTFPPPQDSSSGRGKLREAASLPAFRKRGGGRHDPHPPSRPAQLSDTRRRISPPARCSPWSRSRSGVDVPGRDDAEARVVRQDDHRQISLQVGLLVDAKAITSSLIASAISPERSKVPK